MKASLSKNKRFIFLSEYPPYSGKDALKVYFQRPPLIELKAYDMPIMTTDIKKNKKRYFLPRDWSEDFEIIKIEIKMNKKHLSKVMSDLGKLSAKKSPRPKEYYQRIQKLSVAKQRAKKDEQKI